MAMLGSCFHMVTIRGIWVIDPLAWTFVLIFAKDHLYFLLLPCLEMVNFS